MNPVALAVLLPLVVFALFPLVWMVLTSFKPYAEVYVFPPRYWPSEFGLDFYRQVLDTTPFFSFFANSFVVAVVSTAVSVLFGAMSGWIFARRRIRGSQTLLRSVLLAYLFPQILVVMPFFVVLNALGLANSHLGLILAYVTLNYPFAAWLLTDYFRRLPLEIEEQARVDGASEILVFLKIVLPLAAPGLATAAIFAFINSWNEFLYALVILGAGGGQTLTVGLYGFVGGENAQWGPMMAATVMTMVPTLLLFLLVQKRLVGGMTAGAVRG